MIITVEIRDKYGNLLVPKHKPVCVLDKAVLRIDSPKSTIEIGEHLMKELSLLLKTTEDCNTLSCQIMNQDLSNTGFIMTRGEINGLAKRVGRHPLTKEERVAYLEAIQEE